MVQGYNSLNDLFQMALEELGVQDTGQPVAAEDAQILADRWPSVQQELNARNVGWFDETAVEPGTLRSLAQILAYSAINAFSITDAAKVAWLEKTGGKDGDAERTLKDFRRLRTPRQTMRTEQFTRYRYGKYRY
jgi:hypothetical protein